MRDKKLVAKFILGWVWICAWLFALITIPAETIIRTVEEILKTPTLIIILISVMLVAVILFPLDIGLRLLKLKKSHGKLLIIIYISILILSITVKLVRYNSYAKENMTKLDSQDVTSLLLALKDKNYYVRKRACEAMINLRDEQAVDLLIAALNDRNFYTRYCAGKALAEIGDKRAVRPLIEALKNEVEDKFNRQKEGILYIYEPPHAYIVRALIKITGENFGDYYEKWQDWWNSNKEQFKQK